MLKPLLHIFISGLILSLNFCILTGYAQSSGDHPKSYNINTSFSTNFQFKPYLSGLRSSAGYRFNPFISTGAGVGIERYSNMEMYDTLKANLTLLPVFAEIRYTLSDKKVSPVAALSAGYKFMLNECSSQVAAWDVVNTPPFYNHYDEYDYYNQGGFFFSAEAGIKVKMNRHFSLIGTVSYAVWSVSGNHYKWNYLYLSASGGDRLVNYTMTMYPTKAYNQLLQVNIGVGF